MQRIIVDAIDRYLSRDAEIENDHRKKLRPNMFAPWELKTGRYRAFYAIEETQTVKILTIGYKDDNDLFIRGKKVRL